MHGTVVLIRRVSCVCVCVRTMDLDESTVNFLNWGWPTELSIDYITFIMHEVRGSAGTDLL